MSTRIAIALVLAAAGVSALGGACIQGGDEGDRCNPNLSHEECGSGLTCQQPNGCAESYCCPADLASSTSSFCRSDPEACPLEAGVDAAADAPSGS